MSKNDVNSTICKSANKNTRVFRNAHVRIRISTMGGPFFYFLCSWHDRPCRVNPGREREIRTRDVALTEFAAVSWRALSDVHRPILPFFLILLSFAVLWLSCLLWLRNFKGPPSVFITNVTVDKHTWLMGDAILSTGIVIVWAFFLVCSKSSLSSKLTCLPLTLNFWLKRIAYSALTHRCFLHYPKLKIFLLISLGLQNNLLFSPSLPSSFFLIFS